MLEKLEQIAEKIVDYFYSSNTNITSKKKNQKKENIKKEEVNSVYYEIIPYHMNDFSFDIFKKLLDNFASFSDRVNFFIIWNNVSKKLIVSFPEILEKKFINRFYNYFPSSKIVKINEDFSMEDRIKDILYSENYTWYIGVNGDINLKDNDFYKEFFYLFKDVPAKAISCIRYSLVLNSKSQIEKENSEEEIVAKWWGELLYDFLRWILKITYIFFSKLFWISTKKEKKQKEISEKLSTWINGTAISIAIYGKTFYWLYYALLKKKLNNEVYKSDNEVFSKISILEFTKMFHIPTKQEKIEWLSYINYKRLAPPSNLPSETENITILWKADWANEKQIVWLKQEDKARHVYIIWKTGVGKSTLLSNMIFSDLEKWRGIALLDPHGDLINTILNILPESRKDDVVLFDVSNTENPVWFNVFDNNGYSKDLQVSSILSVFKKLYWNSWWPRLEYIFRNVLLALSDYENANFLHIIKMLQDKQFRKKVLIHIKDPLIKDFWEKEFSKRSERFAAEAIAPIMNKVGQFVSSPIIRNIFWQSKSTINIQNIMQEWKILLVNLSKGLIWDDNSNMIGSFIVTQIQNETMKRANIPMEERKEFTLYIDEFQNFATESFAVILSEARKYNLSLVVANQYISQVDESIQNAIFGNIWNIIAFNSGNKDAEVLQKQFKNQVTVDDITSIPRFKAYTKIMIDGTSTDVFSLSTYPIEKEKYKTLEFVNKVKAISNKKYTRKKEDVEKDIVELTMDNKKENEKSNISDKKNDIKVDEKIIENKDDKIYEWVVKLKFNYWLFVVANGYEWLLHKKNINLPEWISWKDYYNVWDKVKVKLIEFKEVDGQKKAVWEWV